MYLLADLSTVWVNLAVYPKDAGRVKQGQKVTIEAVGSDNKIIGTISYVTPVMDVQTRKITARVVVPNGSNTWRPGTFVNANLETGEGEQDLLLIETQSRFSTIKVSYSYNTNRGDSNRYR